MREDDDIGHYVPLLRRISILVAVVIAVPVMLWTITAFVRSYVGPPHMPTFHQLAATASINAPSAGTGPEAAAPVQQGGGESGALVEASASDARDGAAPKGDRPAEIDAQGTTPAGAVPASPLADGNGATGTPPSGQAAAGADDASAASQALSGPIPLPRPRPRDAEMRTADNAPSDVPMPRRRPEGAGQSAPSETTGASPLGFIQNLFH
jgi:hypothetical protein